MHKIKAPICFFILIFLLSPLLGFGVEQNKIILDNKNPVKEKLKQGMPVFGAFVTIPDPAVVENYALTRKLDFVWIEAEHSVISLKDVQNMVRAAENYGFYITPIVRVPQNNVDVVKRYLGTGVCGIIIPTVNNAREAEYAVRCIKYAPYGNRPAGVERASGYLSNFKEYIASANDKIMVIIMIETKEAAENIEEIIKVKGIDVLHVGPYDMSLSYSALMGLPPGSKQVQEAVKKAVAKIERLAKRYKIPLGSYAPTLKAAREKMEKGYLFFTIPDDTAMLRNEVKHFFFE